MMKILFGLLIARPFISAEAFPGIDKAYSLLLLISACFCLSWAIYHKRHLTQGNSNSLILPAAIFTVSFLPAVFSSCTGYTNALIHQCTGLAILSCFALLDKQERAAALCCLTASGLGVALLAIYQYLFGFRHLSEYMLNNGITSSIASDYIASRRVFLPFVTPNALGGYLAMLLPLRIAQGKNPLLPLALMATALLLTKSLGGMLAILCALPAIYLIGTDLGKIKKYALPAFILLSIFFIVFILRNTASVASQNPFFSLQMRFSYWKETFSLIKLKPFLGHGLGNCKGTTSLHPHNLFLQTWCELGIISTFAFIWFIWAVAQKAITHIRLTKNKTFKLFLASWMIFLAHNLLDFTFQLPQVTAVWWAVGGLIIAEMRETNVTTQT